MDINSIHCIFLRSMEISHFCFLFSFCGKSDLFVHKHMHMYTYMYMCVCIYIYIYFIFKCPFWTLVMSFYFATFYLLSKINKRANDSTKWDYFLYPYAMSTSTLIFLLLLTPPPARIGEICIFLITSSLVSLCSTKK